MLNVAAPPSIEPAPSAAERIAAPGSPVPRLSNARRTNRTSQQPIASMRTVISPTSTRASASWRITRSPASMPASDPSSVANSMGATGERRPIVATVASARQPDATRNTSAGVPTTRIAAAASGPPSKPAPSIRPLAPFAVVQSSGATANAGSSADWVGRVTTSDDAVTAARAYVTNGGVSAAIARPVASIPAAWNA